MLNSHFIGCNCNSKKKTQSNIIPFEQVRSHGAIFPECDCTFNQTAVTQCKQLWFLFYFLLAHLESAYSLIWGSHKIWGKGGRDTLDLL